MKKLFIVLGILVANSAQAQTVDVSTLSEIDQQKHRVGYCYGITSWNINELDFEYEDYKILDIYNLMRSNKFISVSDNHSKAKEDVKAMLIVGDLELNQTMFDECNEDMKAILKKTYVPNFSYMQK